MGNYTIPIHGELGVDFTVSDMVNHLAAAQDANYLILDFDSVGGDVRQAYDMADLLIQANKPIFSRNSGHVASAATYLYVLANKENRYFDATKGKFLIHNPFAPEIYDADATLLKEWTAELSKIENDYIKHYEQRTGADSSLLKAAMSINEPLTAEQIKNLGFASNINLEKQPLKAVARLNINTKMENNEELKKEVSALSKIVGELKKTFGIKAEFVVDAASGQTLTFPEINNESEIVEGVKIDAADGDYEIPSIGIITVADMVVTAITQPMSEEEAKIQELEAKLAESETQNATLQAKMGEFEAQYKKVSALMSDHTPKATQDIKEEKGTKQTFTYNKKRK